VAKGQRRAAQGRQGLKWVQLGAFDRAPSSQVPNRSHEDEGWSVRCSCSLAGDGSGGDDEEVPTRERSRITAGDPADSPRSARRRSWRRRPRAARILPPSACPRVHCRRPGLGLVR
jgi:hypothetical protein